MRAARCRRRRAEPAEPRARAGGSSSRIIRRISSKPASRSSSVERQRAGQQLVEHHAERVDVGARVDVEPVISACSGLMYSGVPIELPSSVNSVCSVSVLRRRLGDAEVDDLRHRRRRRERDQHVRRLEIAMDDPLLVRVLDARRRPA